MTAEGVVSFERTPAGGEAAVRVEEAARRLAISRTLAFRLIREGQLASIKIAGARRVPVDAIEEFVSAQRDAETA